MKFLATVSVTVVKLYGTATTRSPNIDLERYNIKLNFKMMCSEKRTDGLIFMSTLCFLTVLCAKLPKRYNQHWGRHK